MTSEYWTGGTAEYWKVERNNIRTAKYSKRGRHNIGQKDRRILERRTVE
jgi:hypothetical protein